MGVYTFGNAENLQGFLSSAPLRVRVRTALEEVQHSGIAMDPDTFDVVDASDGPDEKVWVDLHFERRSPKWHQVDAAKILAKHGVRVLQFPESAD